MSMEQFFSLWSLSSCAELVRLFVKKKTQVYDSSVIAYPPIVHQHGLVTTVLGLHMELDSSHFEDGLMRVKCLTSISPLIPIHSMETGNAAEPRESPYSGNVNINSNNNNNNNNNGNRKTSHAQRKPPLTDSREVFLLGKCIIKSIFIVVFSSNFRANFAPYFSTPSSNWKCTFSFRFTETYCSIAHYYVICLSFTVAWIQFTTSHFLRHFYIYVFLCF